MYTMQYQRTVNYSAPMMMPANEELKEVRNWAGLAQTLEGQALSFVQGCEDHHLCRMNFTVVSKDRKGCPQIHMCASKSIGRTSAVLICRKELPLFAEVQIQLDDETERPWVRAKVTESAQTVGGYAVRVEFLAEARQAA